jgi:DNA-binding transcriptional LysR family regulator
MTSFVPTTVQQLVAMDLGMSVVPEMAARADRSRQRRYFRIRKRCVGGVPAG